MNKAKALLETRTLKDLLLMWDMTTAMPHSVKVATVRGWILDELENRVPEQFNNWLDSDCNTDESIHLFIKA